MFALLALSDAVQLSIVTAVSGVLVAVVTALGAVLLAKVNRNTSKIQEIHTMANGRLTEMQAKVESLHAELAASKVEAAHAQAAVASAIQGVPGPQGEQGIQGEKGDSGTL